MYENDIKKQFIRKIIRTIIFGFIIFLFSWILFFDSASFVKLIQVKRKHQKLNAKINNKRKENELRAKQIEDLKNDPEMWEKVAREKYGMQKKDEKVYRFVPKDKKGE